MNINLIISDSHVFVKNNISKIFSNMDYIKYDFNNSSLDELIYDFCSVSLFDDHKYIVVENSDEIFSKGFESDDLMNYLKNPSDLSTIVFVSSKVDKSNDFYKYILSKFQVFDSTEKKYTNNLLAVKNYVKEHNSHISDKSLEYIKDATLNNYDLMISEIDKLLILGKDNISDELVNNLVPLTPDGNTNNLIDSLLLMDDKEAIKNVRNMETLSVDLTKMIALLAWNVRVVYLIKKFRKDKDKLNDVLSTYKIPDFKYNKYVKMGNIRSEEDLENLLISLSDLDEKIKKFVISRDMVGYHLINIFCI